MSATGTFYCPNDLASTRDTTHIPEGWNIVQHVTVHLDANDGSERTTDESVTVENGFYLAPDCPFSPIDEKPFAGWTFSNDGITLYSPGDLIPGNQKNLYARWGSIVKVKWDANGGTFGDGETTKTVSYLPYDEFIAYTEEPAWSSTDVFDKNWYTDVDCTTLVTFPYTMQNTDVTFYAGWNHTISWYDEDGTTLLHKNTAAHKKTPAYNGDMGKLVKVGKAFMGWTPEVAPASCSTSYKAVFVTPLEG